MKSWRTTWASVLIAFALAVACWFGYRHKDSYAGGRPSSIDATGNVAVLQMEQRSTHKFLGERAILLGTVVDDQTARDVADDLTKLNSESTEDITLYVNSPGGAAKAGWAILDALDTSKALVHTVCMRRVGGVATFIFASGSHRSGLADCLVSFDEFSEGNSRDTSSIEQWRVRFIGRIAPKLKISQDTLSEWISTNRTFSGRDLQELGLMDLAKK